MLSGCCRIAGIPGLGIGGAGAWRTGWQIHRVMGAGVAWFRHTAGVIGAVKPRDPLAWVTGIPECNFLPAFPTRMGRQWC